MAKFAFQRWTLAGLVGLSASACAANTSATPAINRPAATSTPTTPAVRALTLTPTIPPVLTFTPQPTAMPDTSGVLPIFEGETGFVLGGVRDGQWLDADETAALATGEIGYRLFLEGSLTGGVDRVITIPPPGSYPCPFPRVSHFHPELTDTIGVAGDWDVVPRTPDSLGLDMPEYVSVVEEVLTENGVGPPQAILTEVLRVDLEGDGTDEVLISASRLYGMRKVGHILPEVKAGDYALVALRKVVEGEAKMLVLDLNTYPETFIPGYFWLPTVLTLLDLNGDGDLEIVVEQQAFEGRLIEVYEVNGREVNMVLRAGCSI